MSVWQHNEREDDDDRYLLHGNTHGEDDATTPIGRIDDTYVDNQWVIVNAIMSVE